MMNPLLTIVTLVAGGNPAPVHPIAVCHHGRHEGNTLVWESLAVVDAVDLFRGLDRLPLAVPLPHGASVESDAHIQPVHGNDGRVIALDVAGGWGPERHLRDRWTRGLAFTVRQPVDDRERTAMRPPLLAGKGVQRVTMAGMENLMYEPDPTIGVERHVRHFVAQEVSGSMRRECKRLLREHGAPDADGLAIFVTANPQTLAAGDLGTIVSRESHRQLVATGAVAGCAVLALLMLLVYKRLNREARLRRNLALIDRIDHDLAEFELDEANPAKPADTR